MPASLAESCSAAEITLDYHRRTKHRFDRYAPGPSTLDWDMQPAPFRHYANTLSQTLPLIAQLRDDSHWSPWLNRPFGSRSAVSAPVDTAAVGVLLNLALGITAWKTLGPDRWALRANPSSGNLHPIEAYVIAAGVDGLADGVWHYDPLDHGLNQRAAFAAHGLASGTLLIGLTSVLWREAWKYGERAFRYCALDCGHAMAALAYAADILGWRLVERCELPTAQVAALLGIDRAADFPGDVATEREHAEILLAIRADHIELCKTEDLLAAAAAASWHGVATPIDKHPLFRWPVVDAVAAATEQMLSQQPVVVPPMWAHTISAVGFEKSAVDTILGRRSAQRFDARFTLSAAQFSCLVGAINSVHAVTASPQLALLFFVQRVEGVLPGIYLLPRAPDHERKLRALLPTNYALTPHADIPGLLQLTESAPDPQTFRRVLRSLHCHQDIAATANVAVAMLAPVNSAVNANPADYRQVLREAGMIGQALYLHAEAVGLRGTGIGCYFDEPVREFVGLSASEYQSLYHFTLGMPIDDPRLEMGPAYPQRREDLKR